jgi:hypothetical protein
MHSNDVPPSVLAVRDAKPLTPDPRPLTVPADPCETYLAQSVSKDVLQQSIPTQNRQLIDYNSNNNGQVGGLEGELTSAKRLLTHCV